MRKLPLLIALLLVTFASGAWNFKEKYKGTPKLPPPTFPWHADILPGYEARYVNQGEAFDSRAAPQ